MSCGGFGQQASSTIRRLQDQAVMAHTRQLHTQFKEYSLRANAQEHLTQEQEPAIWMKDGTVCYNTTHKPSSFPAHHRAGRCCGGTYAGRSTGSNPKQGITAQRTFRRQARTSTRLLRLLWLLRHARSIAASRQRERSTKTRCVAALMGCFAPSP